MTTEGLPGTGSLPRKPRLFTWACFPAPDHLLALGQYPSQLIVVSEAVFSLDWRGDHHASGDLERGKGQGQAPEREGDAKAGLTLHGSALVDRE